MTMEAPGTSEAPGAEDCNSHQIDDLVAVA
jgi:hypothetical protein